LRPVLAAGVERVSPDELERLLCDGGFAKLVAHYQALARLPAEERLGRLETAALELLELAVDAGDLRTAAFVLDERSRGRNPARTLAEGVVASLKRAGRPGPERQAVAAAVAPLADAGREGEAAAKARPTPGGLWDECAATLPSEAAAEAKAMAEAEATRLRLQHTAARLRTRLMGELERMGTVDQREVELRAFARVAHRDPERGIRAAARIQAMRDAGRPASAAGVEPRAPAVPPAENSQRTSGGGGGPPATPSAPAHSVRPAPGPYATPFQRAGPPGTVFMAETRFNPLKSG
jgi:hypothetical protein